MRRLVTMSRGVRWAVAQVVLHVVCTYDIRAADSYSARSPDAVGIISSCSHDEPNLGAAVHGEKGLMHSARAVTRTTMTMIS